MIKNNLKEKKVKICTFSLDFEAIKILEKLSNDTNTSKSKIICDLIKKEANNGK